MKLDPLEDNQLRLTHMLLTFLISSRTTAVD